MIIKLAYVIKHCSVNNQVIERIFYRNGNNVSKINVSLLVGPIPVLSHTERLKKRFSLWNYRIDNSILVLYTEWALYADSALRPAGAAEQEARAC